MIYETFESSDELSPLVKCYWSLESPPIDPPEVQTIVPDGCMEMIFHFGDPFRQFLADGVSVEQPRCFVIGQLTRPLEIVPTGRTGIFSVRFQPDGFLPFATIPIKEMENTAVPLHSLFGLDGSDLESHILSSESSEDRIRHIEHFFIDRLTNSDSIDRIVKSAVDTILTANGQISVTELSLVSNVNRRQLERRFSSAIGLSPKKLTKTIRLQAALKKMLNASYTSLTELAYSGDYYDQAHFIKDFKELTGMTPKEFYGDSVKMSTLFYGTD